MDRILHRFDCDVSSSQDVMNANLREYLRWIRGLLRFNPYLVIGNVLSLFAHYVDHIEGSASRQRYCDQLDGPGASVPGCVIDQEIVTRAAGSNKLPIHSGCIR